MPSKSQKAKKSIKNINSIIFCANKYLTESWRPIKFHKKTYQVYFVKFDGPVFSGGFWQISLKLSLYVKNWRKQNAFFSILGLDGSSPNSLGPPGTLWDPFWTLWDPLRGPRESQRRNSSQSSIGKLLGPLFRATFLLNSDLNSSSGTLWDP